MKKKVFVSGDFDILHPGHLRFLKFAKDSGDYLLVGVNSDDINTKLVHEDIRLESIQATNYVDEAFILRIPAIEYIKKNKPEIVVKGVEHENVENEELKIINSYGGKLIFSSGDISFSSLTLLRNEFEKLEISNLIKPLDYIQRHGIDGSNLVTILDKFKSLNILVIGDTIIDEYKTCEPLGMSQEDPTIVVSPISSDIFLGGAGIVASHAAGLGANVDFFTVLGDDDNAKIVKNKIDEYSVKAYIYSDSSRPTTFKQRFRANRKTLLRVNYLKQHHISKDIQDKIIIDIEKKIKDKKLIVFSDFSYGCLPQRLIEKIIALGLKYNIMMVADSQSSSQTGDITKFHNMNLITPTEREARLGVNDFESGLIILSEKLKKRSSAEHVIITLGSEGLLIHADNKNGNWVTDQIPALNYAPKDVAGAGDSLLIASSMAMAVGASVMESAYIGSMAAATQIGRVGNIPLNIEEIKKEITE